MTRRCASNCRRRVSNFWCNSLRKRNASGVRILSSPGTSGAVIAWRK
uniref:Uncharacterized protein n=1 Tax=Parascaris equorum TaxID=6256 RepID=A0A914RW91_PAREQ